MKGPLGPLNPASLLIWNGWGKADLSSQRRVRLARYERIGECGDAEPAGQRDFTIGDLFLESMKKEQTA